MIYFIREVGSIKGKRVKIGYSKQPERRLQELQSSNPSKLKIMHLFPGHYKTEKGLHEMFKKEHIRGEWFRLSPQMKLWLEASKQHPEETNIYSVLKLAENLKLRKTFNRAKKKGYKKGLVAEIENLSASSSKG